MQDEILAEREVRYKEHVQTGAPTLYRQDTAKVAWDAQYFSRCGEAA